jgi:hypothetical protein
MYSHKREPTPEAGAARHNRHALEREAEAAADAIQAAGHSSAQSSRPPEIGPLQGPDQPLPPPVRAFFESAYGYDLGAVRTHTGSEADRLLSPMGARAMTSGPHIALGAVAPARTLAHEIAHVVQQSAAAPLRSAPADASVVRPAATTPAVQFDLAVAPPHPEAQAPTLTADQVAAARFDDAIHVIVDAHHFPTANLANIQFDATVAGADAVTNGVIGTGQPQTVRVGPTAFAAGYEHMIRIIGHELQHVQQRSGAAPIVNQHVREFLSFAWEALDTGAPALSAADRVNHANIAIQHWNAAPVADRTPQQAVRNRLTQLVAAGGVGNF